MKKLSFIKLKLFFICFGLFISSYSYADIIKGNTISIYDENPDKHFIVSNEIGYKHYYFPLKELIWARKKKDITNHFCMIGYKWIDDKEEEEAIIFWQEMNTLYRWKPKSLDSDDIVQLYSLRTAKSYYIDELNNVPLSPTYLGSPKLMLDDAKRIIEDCNSNGEIITVEPIKISEICLKDSICPDVFEAHLAEQGFPY